MYILHYIYNDIKTKTQKSFKYRRKKKERKQN